jgi:hypothetical protein
MVINATSPNSSSNDNHILSLNLQNASYKGADQTFKKKSNSKSKSSQD